MIDCHALFCGSHAPVVLRIVRAAGPQMLEAIQLGG